jgi:hypothetical protein
MKTECIDAELARKDFTLIMELLLVKGAKSIYLDVLIAIQMKDVISVKTILWLTKTVNVLTLTYLDVKK